MVEREEQVVEDTVVFGIRWDGGRRPRLRLAAALAALVAALLPATAAAAPARGLHDAVVVPVRGHDAAARALVVRLGGHPGRRIGIVGGFEARVPHRALARLVHARVIRTAAPDVTLSVRSTEDDPAATAAASSEVVRGASGASALDTNGGGVGVALVDSGAMDLPALHGHVVAGPDFSSEAGDPDLRGLDTFGHGTHLAGVIAGDDPADGFEGVAPGARVVSVKVADAQGETSLLRVLAALEWVKVHHADPGVGVRVVNLSLGVDPTTSSYVREPLAYAVEQLWRAGLVVVAAAGNSGRGAGGQLDLPAADPYVIAVGGLDTAGTVDRSDDTVASFSSSGENRVPDVLAPATRVVSLRVPGSTLDQAFPAARIGSEFFRGSGTSQAAAVVSGLSALLIERHPDLDPDQVKALLVAGAVPLASEPDEPPAVDVAGSAALPVPSAEAVEQHWTPAVLDLHRLRQAGRARHRALGNARWAGSTWSGSTWSGSTWSGSTWSGSTWSGSTWSSASWDGPDGTSGR